MAAARGISRSGSGALRALAHPAPRRRLTPGFSGFRRLRPTQPLYDVALAFGLVLAFSYVFSWISAFIGLSIRDPETVQSAGFIWVFPLVFASSAFVPTSSMPGVLHTFADINPVTLTVNAARALTIGDGHPLTPALGALAWLAGLLLVFIPLSVRAFRHA